MGEFCDIEGRPKRSTDGEIAITEVCVHTTVREANAEE
jgi:hypothetical protein